jgi:threonine/homoserine/homoserine lactone efflux protein
LGLIPRTWRNMVFISDIHVLSAAFFMGLAAAAPMGPVNMLAIRRGLIGGWRHTLACGVGSVTGELILFSLVLLGGHYLFSDLSNPTLQTVLAATGVIVLLPLGIYFLVRAVKEPLQAYKSARKDWKEGTVPAAASRSLSTPPGILTSRQP